jgi:ABC-type branched-subunit amino acid transport system substrate-binding protein
MAATSAEAAGLTAPYVNTSVALTSNDFTAIALAIKAAGADSLFTSMATASNVALIKALKNAGVNIKVSFITAGYQQSLLADPATAQAVEGYDFQAQFPPWILNTAATQAWSSAMATYANYHDPNPLGGHHWGWFTAALMVFGLQKAGTNLTWASFISNLRSTTDYTAGGLIPEPVDFTKFGNVGQASENNCFYMTTVAGGKFQMVSQQPYCGTPVPGTH